jgi:hypothetical protein
MITNAFLFIITGILKVILSIFSGLTYLLPQQIPNAFNLFFSYVRIGDGLFPFLSDILLALYTVLIVWILLYIVKIVLWAYSLLPFVGKKASLPQHQMIKNKSR